MKWIAALEKLPEVGKKVCARKKDYEYYTLSVSKDGIIRVNGATFHNMEILQEWHYGIEWLDEEEEDQDVIWEDILGQLHPYFLREEYQEFKEKFLKEYTISRK